MAEVFDADETDATCIASSRLIGVYNKIEPHIVQCRGTILT